MQVLWSRSGRLSLKMYHLVSAGTANISDLVSVLGVESIKDVNGYRVPCYRL